MVQFKTNFCSQQISASFWYNMGQNFLECIDHTQKIGYVRNHCWKWLKVHFEFFYEFLSKYNLRIFIWCVTAYKNVQGNPKSVKSDLWTSVRSSLNLLNSLLEFNGDNKYFIRVCGILKRGWEGLIAFFTHKYIFF